MVTKSIKLDDNVVEALELVAKGLNEKAGADVYDFSNVIRVAINQYLNSENIKEIIQSVKQKEHGNRKYLLFSSESSLSKDWLKPEEDKAWADL
jgi:predicted transcriptional regulator